MTNPLALGSLSARQADERLFMREGRLWREASFDLGAKVWQVSWLYVLLLCVLADVGHAALYSTAGGASGSVRGRPEVAPVSLCLLNLALTFRAYGPLLPASHIDGRNAAMGPKKPLPRILPSLLPVIALAGSLAECAPFVDVVDVKKIPQTTRDAAMHVQVYPLGMQAPASVKLIGPVEANSCKLSAWDPPATRGNALQQLQVKALALGANAVINVTFDTRGTDPYGTNCWQSVNAAGIAAIMSE